MARLENLQSKCTLDTPPPHTHTNPSHSPKALSPSILTPGLTEFWGESDTQSKSACKGRNVTKYVTYKWLKGHKVRSKLTAAGGGEGWGGGGGGGGLGIEE